MLCRVPRKQCCTFPTYHNSLGRVVCIERFHCAGSFHSSLSVSREHYCTIMPVPDFRASKASTIVYIQIITGTWFYHYPHNDLYVSLFSLRTGKGLSLVLLQGFCPVELSKSVNSRTLWNPPLYIPQSVRQSQVGRHFPSSEENAILLISYFEQSAIVILFFLCLVVSQIIKL